ncbi:hypothetical protein B484DRAFT_103167, partial [Ochromonadaceae sp. CCMP2298]
MALPLAEMALSLQRLQETVQEVLPDLTPLLGAVAFASLVVMVSNSLAKMHKIYFQSACFAVGAVAAMAYLAHTSDAQLPLVWAQFVKLSGETQFCLSLALVSLVYFGGAFYIIPPESEEGSFETPATCDAAVTFEVPAELPESDKELFDMMFDK